MNVANSFNIGVFPVKWATNRSGEKVMVHQSSSYRVYDPLISAPDLWSRFALLSNAPDDILEFANEFGWLSDLDMEEVNLVDSRKKKGIPLSLWGQHIKSFRGALRNWHSLQKKADAKRKLRLWSLIDVYLQTLTTGGFADGHRVVKGFGVRAAVWTQLAEMVEANNEIDLCSASNCSNYYAVNKQGRFRREYCREACKKRTQRAREAK